MTIQEFRRKKWKYICDFHFQNLEDSPLQLNDSGDRVFFLYDVGKQMKALDGVEITPATLNKKRETYKPSQNSSFKTLMLKAVIEGIPLEEVNFVKVICFEEVVEFLRDQKIPHFEKDPQKDLVFYPYDES